MAENQTAPAPAGKFPRIWDTEGERTIIGETRVSWIVVQKGHENDPWVERVEHIRLSNEWVWRDLQENYRIELVKKKEPNKGHSRNQWFLNESEYLAEGDRVKVRAEGPKIARWLESVCWEDKISSATLQQIADLIGYKPNE